MTISNFAIVRKIIASIDPVVMREAHIGITTCSIFCKDACILHTYLYFSGKQTTTIIIFWIVVEYSLPIQRKPVLLSDNLKLYTLIYTALNKYLTLFHMHTKSTIAHGKKLLHFYESYHTNFSLLSFKTIHE